MEHRFHREAIITGCVDSFCLACEEYLKCERDATAHISKPVHRNNLLAVPYMDKYCDDHIRKVKLGYYCEFCNSLLPTATKVGLHVVETHHVDNKATKLLKRIGSTVIAVGNVSISERAWHGLMEDTCAICNVEYDNEDIHKNQPTHILCLIQCKIQYGNKIMYRLIDSDSFQCLTCNMVLSLKTITEHFNNSNHQKLYLQCLVSANPDELHDSAINDHEEKQTELSDEQVFRDITDDQNPVKKQTDPSDEQISKGITDDQNPEEKQTDLSDEGILKDITNVQNPEEKQIHSKNMDNFQLISDPEMIKNKCESPHIEITNEENREKILDSINKIQRSDINIDFERESAFCKKCLKALDFNYRLIEQHIQEHVHKPNNTANSALYYPTVDQNHNKMSLTVCDEPTCDNKTSKDEESYTYKHNIRALTGADEVKSDEIKDTGGKHKGYDSSESSPNECCKENGMKPSASKVTEDPSVSEDVNQFAKRNQLTYSENCRTAYCRICEAKLPATLTAMKEHVAGTAHTIRTNKTSKPKPRGKKSNNYSMQYKSTGEFIESTIMVKNDFKDVERVIINRKYSVHIMSFMLVTKNDSEFRCQLCEVNIIQDDCTDHMNSFGHRNELNKVPVITYLDTEFVREVRPGLFHCGFCHLLVCDWDDLRNHMKCSEHKTRKTMAKIILEKLLREFDEEQRMKEERIRHFMFLRMMFGNPFF